MNARFRTLRYLNIGFGLMSVGTINLGRAQTIVAPALSDSGAPEPTRVEDPHADLSNIMSALELDMPLWQRGPFAVRPHVSYRWMHGTGVEVGPGRVADTDTETLSPGLLLGIGDHWSVDYVPTWTWYSNERFNDSFDQAVTGFGSYSYDRLRVSLNGAYSSMHPTLVETASQAHEVRWSGGVNAQYSLTDRTGIEVSAFHSYRRATNVSGAADWIPSGARDWSSRDSIRWEATDRITTSAGIAFGYTTRTNGPGMSYTQPQVTATWRLTDKTTVDAQAGVEQRRFRRAGTRTLNSPVYSAAIGYRPYPTTSLVVGVTQSVAASYVSNAVTKSRAWKAGLQQRLFQLLYGGVTYSEQRSEFIDTQGPLARLRHDNYSAIECRLSMPVLKRGVIAVVYQRARNASSQVGYAFTSRQVGAEFSYHF